MLSTGKAACESSLNRSISSSYQTYGLRPCRVMARVLVGRVEHEVDVVAVTFDGLLAHMTKGIPLGRLLQVRIAQGPLDGLTFCVSAAPTNEGHVWLRPYALSGAAKSSWNEFVLQHEPLTECL